MGPNTERYEYSVRMRENVEQNNSEYGHFSRSVFISFSVISSSGWVATCACLSLRIKVETMLLDALHLVVAIHLFHKYCEEQRMHNIQCSF